MAQVVQEQIGRPMVFRARCQTRFRVLGTIGPPASAVKSHASGSGADKMCQVLLQSRQDMRRYG